MEKEDIDGIILMTQTPNKRLPTAACQIHKELGLRSDSFAFDINLGCSAYPYGLWVAGSMMQSGASKVILLAGDTISKLTDINDQATSMLFGDAGSAAGLVRKGSEEWNFVVGTDGSDSISVGENGLLKMNGADVFKFTLSTVPKIIKSIDKILGRKHDFYALHQASRFIIRNIRRKCDLDEINCPDNIEHWGNTSCASIPLLIANCINKKQIGKGKRIGVVGYGVGLSWCSASIFIKQEPTCMIIGNNEKLEI